MNFALLTVNVVNIEQLSSRNFLQTQDLSQSCTTSRKEILNTIYKVNTLLFYLNSSGK